MHYKGEDMDLRVPAPRAPREGYPATEYDPAFTNGRWRAAAGPLPPGSEPLWVDETVLACCNMAFDMALAHGAPEVDLDHLVHAMTRVEAASRQLEARGVREGQLRRESAALMASDARPSLTTERAAPRRSIDVEETLRRAVEVAGRRGSAATVDDLLWVLLHFGREQPAVLLLRRLTPDWQRLDWGRFRDAGPVDPPRYVPVTSEPTRYVPVPEPVRYVAAPDGLSQRFALFEDTIRQLHADLGHDRKAMTELIRDMQRDIVAHRGDAAALRSDLGQRLEVLERTLQTRTDTSRQQAQTAERMAQLEKAVHSGLGEGARNWAALGQRLQAFESQIQASREARLDGQPMLDRIAALESAVDARVTDIGRGVAAISDRLVSLERITETSAGEGARRWTALSDRLGNVETSLAARARDMSPDVAGLAERLGGLETAVRSGFGEAARQTQTTSDRIGDVEQLIGTLPNDQGEAVLLIDERLAAIERRIEATVGGQGDLLTRLTSQLATLDAAGGADPARQSEALTKISTTVADLSARLGSVEQSVAQSLTSQSEASTSRDREIAEMHEALIRLGENQHTLASAISDWRLENHNRLAAVTAQIDKLLPPEITQATAVDERRMPQVVSERAKPRLDEDVPQITAETPSLTAAAATVDEPEIIEVPAEKRSGFWWWLFGTDSIARANREADIRWERMRQKMREARERRREQA